MNKHKSADQKLHVRQPLSANSRKIMAAQAQGRATSAAPKGTNTANQYR